MQECSISARTGVVRVSGQALTGSIGHYHFNDRTFYLELEHTRDSDNTICQCCMGSMELKADTALEEQAARFATKVIMIATCTRVAKMLDMNHLPTRKERHASCISWTDTPVVM